MNPIGQAFPVIKRAYAFSSYFDQPSSVIVRSHYLSLLISTAPSTVIVRSRYLSLLIPGTALLGGFGLAGRLTKNQKVITNHVYIVLLICPDFLTLPHLTLNHTTNSINTNLDTFQDRASAATHIVSFPMFFKRVFKTSFTECLFSRHVCVGLRELLLFLLIVYLRLAHFNLI